MKHLALALLLASAHSAAADSWAEGPAGKTRKRNLLLTVTTGVAYAVSETALKYSFSPDDCRWCTPPSIDVGARNALVWSDLQRARTASDVVGHLVVPVFAVGAVNLTLVGHGAGWGEIFDVTLPVLEAAFVSQLVTYVAKGALGRERPDRNFGVVGSSDAEDKNVSFWSGHTALAFAFATSAGTVASQRRSRAAPLIWGVGLTLATATGYLRIAGDKHYLTDVVVGAGVGMAIGYVIPRLMQHDVGIASDGKSVVLTGRF